MKQSAVLRQQNAKLLNRVAELEEQLRHLTAQGAVTPIMAGERVISDLTAKLSTANAGCFYLETPGGLNLRVKKSAATRSLVSSPSTRWQWANVLHERGGESYDYLLLAGDAEMRYRPLYREPNSLLVLFCVPFEDVRDLSAQGQQGTRIIRLSTNPHGVRTDSGRRMYERYQVTMNDLKNRFDI